MMPSNGPLKNSFEADIVKLIGQHLTNMGLKQTVESLLRETGLSSFENPIATRFQHAISNGSWDEAIELLDELMVNCEPKEKPNLKRDMQLLISEQKFMELIDDNQCLKAVKCLRLELTPPYIAKNNLDRIKHLASLLFCKSSDEFRSKAEWSGKGSKSRQNLLNQLQKFAPPIMMLPSNRLQTLISQAVQLQRTRCTLHKEYCNDDLENVDLKHDHFCKPDNFPIYCRQVFDAHKGEIWLCKFSNNGLKLATGGHGGNIKIWDVDLKNHKLDYKCQLDNHGHSVNCLSWSPRDDYIVACIADTKPGINIWNMNKVKMEETVVFDEDLSAATCSWHPSGNYFAVASIKGNFVIYDLKGLHMGSREGVRVQCLSFLHKDDKHILAADNLHRIRAYKLDYFSKRDRGDNIGEVMVIRERHPIMSFVIDNEDQYIAINLAEQGVHLWDYRTKTMLKVFSHSRQCNYITHSSFSGSGTLLATGSEDGRVYIYHVQKDDPIAILHGHSRCANCVSWNPKHPGMLVSVGDDRLMRLWGPATEAQSLTSGISHPILKVSTSINGMAASSLGSNAHFIYNELAINSK